MSKAYRDAFGGEVIEMDLMREWLKKAHPKKDSSGRILYLTEQHHKDRCDVNQIVRRYAKTGVLDHVTSIEASYGTMTGRDFKEMVDKVDEIRGKFQEFPSAIRNRFRNDPAELMQFFDDPKNRDEAIKLGLIRSDWIEAADGIGEADRKVKVPEPVPFPTK